MAILSVRSVYCAIHEILVIAINAINGTLSSQHKLRFALQDLAARAMPTLAGVKPRAGSQEAEHSSKRLRRAQK
jgi:hypothetical protein